MNDSGAMGSQVCTPSQSARLAFWRGLGLAVRRRPGRIGRDLIISITVDDLDVSVQIGPRGAETLRVRNPAALTVSATGVDALRDLLARVSKAGRGAAQAP